MASIELFSGTDPQVIGYEQVTATPAFDAGDLVICDAAGVTIATTDGQYLGIARDGSDTTVTNPNKKIRVELLNANSVYSVRLATTAVADNVSDAATTLAGEGVGVTQFTRSAQMWSDSTVLSGVCVGLDPRESTTGVTAGRILVRFLSSVANQVVY